jgi:hypothetical protein
MVLAAEDLVRGAAPAPKIGSSSQLQRASRSRFSPTVFQCQNKTTENSPNQNLESVHKSKPSPLDARDEIFNTLQNSCYLRV